MDLRRFLTLAVAGAAGAFALIQLVPYGHDHANPRPTGEPRWDSPRTRALARAACFDCHSDETSWPWYTNVAPFSWLAQHDVDEGRSRLNFSEWDRTNLDAIGEIGDVVREGGMPPWEYLLIHSNARLTDAQRQALADGLEATLRISPPGAAASAP